LENGLVFCRVESWSTGRRLVSLPFSDHCEPLADDATSLLTAAEQSLRQEKLHYLEVRPITPLAGWHTADTYVFHALDLRPGLDTLFGNLHKNSTQRKIQRAEREGLSCEAGRSRALLDAFYDLLVVTRRRHQVLPQPKRWFRNLIDCFGEALQIRVAFSDRQPVAAILTLRHRDTLVYKYGCSDAAFNNLGGTQLLFWKAIQGAKFAGLQTFDLGRTDCDNEGLITFKNRLGATRSSLTYSRLSLSPPAARRSGPPAIRRLAQRILPWVPDRVLIVAGSVLYRHVG
jgi:hypothetical protein